MSEPTPLAASKTVVKELCSGYDIRSSHLLCGSVVQIPPKTGQPPPHSRERLPPRVWQPYQIRSRIPYDKIKSVCQNQLKCHEYQPDYPQKRKNRLSSIVSESEKRNPKSSSK